MPTFAFMSGYLIKKEEVTVNVGRQLISRLLIPYAIMEVMLKACLSIAMIVSPDPTKWHWTFGSMTDWSLLFVTPTFQGWYLISLCVWRLVLPLVSTLRCNVFVRLSPTPTPIKSSFPLSQSIFVNCNPSITQRSLLYTFRLPFWQVF